MTTILGYDRHLPNQAALLFAGRPEYGLRPTLGHMLTNAVSRTLIRHSPRPVVMVPDVVDSLQ